MARVELDIDMSGVEAKEGFEILPADNYRVRIAKCEYKQNTTEGKSDYLNLEYEVVNHPDFAGRKLFGVQVIPSSRDAADKRATNAGMFKAWLEHFKLDGMVANGFDTTDFMGAEADASVTVKMYTANDGTQKQKNEITKFL